MDTNTNKNTPNGPTKVNPVMTPNVQAQENQKIPTNKMSKVDKIRIWAGIGFIMFVVIFVFISVIVPNIIADKEPCNMFSSYGNIKMCSFGGLYVWGLIGSFFLGVPFAIAGISFILYSIFHWKKVKNPGSATFLAIVLIILLLALLLFGAFFFANMNPHTT